MSSSSESSQQPNISIVPKKDASGKPIPGTCEGSLVRIRLFDGRERVLMFKENPSPTTKQVCQMIARKLDLTEAAAPLFSLWIVGKELELQLRPKMELQDMVDKWPKWLEKYTHATDINPAFKFVYKREAMVHKDQELELNDDVAIKLIYGEARNNVMSGRYPIANTTEAVMIAAIQLQITHGDFNSSKHGPGTNIIQQSLSTLLPKYILGKLKVADWEQRISTQWRTLGASRKPGGATYKTYLEHCMAWDYYGSTFYPACKNVPPQGFFELRTDHLMIAVNRSGIAIIDDDRHKVSWYGDFQGIEWECTPDSMTIEYRPTGNNPDGSAPKKMASTLISPQSHLIDSLASRSIYLIEKQTKKKTEQSKTATWRKDKKRSSAMPESRPLSPTDEKHAKRLSEQSANLPHRPQSADPEPVRQSARRRASSVHSDDGGHADYLRAVKEARSQAN